MINKLDPNNNQTLVKTDILIPSSYTICKDSYLNENMMA